MRSLQLGFGTGCSARAHLFRLAPWRPVSRRLGAVGHRRRWNSGPQRTKDAQAIDLTFIVLSLNPLLASPVWMHALQTLGFVMGTVALGLGFALAGGWEAKDSSE